MGRTQKSAKTLGSPGPMVVELTGQLRSDHPPTHTDTCSRLILGAFLPRQLPEAQTRRHTGTQGSQLFTCSRIGSSPASLPGKMWERSPRSLIICLFLLEGRLRPKQMGCRHQDLACSPWTSRDSILIFQFCRATCRSLWRSLLLPDSQLLTTPLPPPPSSAETAKIAAGDLQPLLESLQEEAPSLLPGTRHPVETNTQDGQFRLVHHRVGPRRVHRAHRPGWHSGCAGE